jgi:mRNA interferase RelE/StbE
MYSIEYIDSVRDDLKKISKPDKDIIRKTIEKKLIPNPLDFGKPLQYSKKGLRSLRVGDYRVIFKIEDITVIVVKIGHRKEVYD